MFGVDAEDVPKLRKERKNLKTDPRFDELMADIEVGPGSGGSGLFWGPFGGGTWWGDVPTRPCYRLARCFSRLKTLQTPHGPTGARTVAAGRDQTNQTNQQRHAPNLAQGGMFGDKDYFKPLVDSISNMKVGAEQAKRRPRHGLARGSRAPEARRTQGTRSHAPNPGHARARTHPEPPHLPLIAKPPFQIHPPFPGSPPSRSATTGSWWPTTLPTTCARRRRWTRWAAGRSRPGRAGVLRGVRAAPGPGIPGGNPGKTGPQSRRASAKPACLDPLSPPSPQPQPLPLPNPSPYQTARPSSRTDPTPN